VIRFSMRFLCKLGMMLSLLAPAACAQTLTLRVAAAADLQYAMGDLAGEFEKLSGIKIITSFGSSGNIRSQIQNGAPFDLFFSADAQYPRQLVAAGFGDADSWTVYAHGHLVLWAPAEAKLGLTSRGMEVLQDPRVQKIAIANPELAPYGRAAVAVLQKARLYDVIKAKLIFGENISQAAQFAQSGNAQVGILAFSLTLTESMKSGERWEVSGNLYPTLEQAAVIVSASRNKKAARTFLDFVKGSEGQRILTKYGLALGNATPKP
jgi:molybdate transport system substrate-binding protein